MSKFHRLEVEGRGSETQLQVGVNLNVQGSLCIITNIVIVLL